MPSVTRSAPSKRPYLASLLACIACAVLFLARDFAAQAVAQAPPSSAAMDGSPPMAWAERGRRWTLYSRDVNRVTCDAEGGDATWLGTLHGVKRIDRRTGDVRLYTRQDGLPGDVVLAVAADGPGAWALVWAGPQAYPYNDIPQDIDRLSPQWNYDGPVILCRLRRPGGHWERIQKQTLPRTWSYWHDGGVEGYTGPRRAMLVSGPRFVCLLISPYAGFEGTHPKAIFSFYDKQRRQWTDVPAAHLIDHPEQDDAFHTYTITQTLHGTTLQILMDLGVSDSRPYRALFFYSLRTGAWHYHDIKSKSDAWYKNAWIESENGLLQGKSLWLCEAGSQQRNQKDIYSWRLVRLSLDGHVHVVITRSECDASAPTPAVPVMTEASDGTIWVSQARLSGLHASFWHFSPQTGRVRRYEWGDTRVPDSALRPLTEHMPGTPGNVTLAEATARRLHGWISPNATLPRTVRHTTEATRTAVALSEANWSVNGVGALVRSRDGRRDVFPISKIKGGVLASVTSVAAIGQTVYCVIGETSEPNHRADLAEQIQVFDLETGRWKPLPLPEPMIGATLTVTASPDGRLLVSFDGFTVGLLRYTPDTGRWDKAWEPDRFSADGRVVGKLLGTDTQDDVWTTGSQFNQVQHWHGTSPPRAMTLNLPTHLSDPNREGRSSSLDVVTFCGDRIWVVGHIDVNGASDVPALLGWDPATGDWTPPQLFSHYRIQPDAFSAGEDGDVYIATADSYAAVQHWDEKLRRWRVAAPPLPGYHDPQNDTLFQVASWTGNEVWLTGDQALWHFQKDRGLWQHISIPDEEQHAAPMSVCRNGNEFFIGTVQGLWRVNGSIVHSVPVPVTGLTIQQIAADQAGAWAICDVPPLPQSGLPPPHTVAARLDAHSGRWRLTTAATGYPEWDTYAAPPELWDTGGEAWLNTENGTWHWDRSDGHWHPISQYLGLPPGPGMGVFIRSVAGDGRYDWLLTAGVYEPNDFHAVPPPPIPALVRYDTQTGRYKGYDRGLKLFQLRVPIPLRRPDQLGQGLLASPDALWVHADKFLYRVNKATGVWKQASQDNWPTLPIGAMTWANGAVWITDADSVFRYQGK